MRNPFRRRVVEQRSVTSVPWDVGGPLSAAVDANRALSLAPVFSATSLLAGSISTLPVKVYVRSGELRRPLDPLPPLLGLLDTSGCLISWLHRCITSLLLRGNAYGLVTARDDFGYPTAIEWLDPSSVSVYDSALTGPGSYSAPQWYWLGRPVATEDLVHIAWYTTPYRIQGLSPISAFQATINAGLYVTAYGNTWFEAGGFPPGTFANSATEVDQTTAAAIGARLDMAMKRRRPLVFGKDWTYTPISVPPSEAQFVEAAHLNANQIAAIYHVPADWIGGQSSGGLHYSTAEQDQIQYVLHGVRPWVEVLESAFSALLPEGQYVKFNLDALIRADLKTRHEVYEIDARIGLRTVNEMRAQEDWQPLPPEAPDGAEDAQVLAEMVRKMYLGVGVFITPDEAREIMNRADGRLPIPAPNLQPPTPSPEPAGVGPTSNGRV